MPDIHGIVLATTRDKALIDAAKARVNCVIALRNSLEDSHETLVAEIPQVQALRRDIEQRQTICRVDCKRHDRIVLLNHVEVIARLEAVIADAVMCVSTEDGLIVAEKGERIDSHAVPIIEYRTL